MSRRYATWAARACAVLVALLVWGLALPSAAARLDLAVDIDPGTRRFDAVAEIVAEGDFMFALHRSLAVRKATVDGRPVEATAHGEGEMRQWRIAAPRGAKLNIEYGGTLPALDAALDHRSVLRSMVPMASSAGTFLPSGSGWYPQPRGLFTFSVRLSLPRGQLGLVAGRIAAETLPGAADEQYLARFEFDQPTDGVDLMAGPYVVKEKWLARAGAKPLRLRTYFYPELDALADGYLDDTARYIELYSQQIGAYPYDGFSIVASPLPTGFGMPTLTYIGARVLKLPFIRATSLGHEVLHNWWGNGVYPDYARGNWSEGLTTFMADYFFKERESAAAAREMRQAWLRDIAAVPADAQRPLAAFRSRTHGAEAAVGYGKAAMVFFMLRDTVGAEAYARGIRTFWQKHRFTAASWADLRSAFENASGRPLGTFFDQWVQRAGAPKVTLSDARARHETGAIVLTLTVTQSASAYALRVPIEIMYAGKSETRTVDVDKARQIVALRLDRMPEGVRVDPDLRLWRVLDPLEIAPILRQWIVARAPGLVIASSEESVRLAAGIVAESLFESPPREAARDLPAASREPVLVVGLHGDIDALLAAHRLPPRPALASARGSAAVWTVENPRGSAPLAVVSARDADALKAVARALPHYGSQSYLVFEGDKVVERGIWPAHAPVVPVRSDRTSVPGGATAFNRP